MFIPMSNLTETWLTNLAALFSCKLLHDAVNNSGYIASNSSITHKNDKKESGGKRVWRSGRTTPEFSWRETHKENSGQRTFEPDVYRIKSGECGYNNSYRSIDFVFGK